MKIYPPTGDDRIDEPISRDAAPGMEGENRPLVGLTLYVCPIRESARRSFGGEVVRVKIDYLRNRPHFARRLAESVAKMKKGVMIINTSRGALVDASAVIEGLKSEQIGYLGLDVYEQEADLFYENLSERIIQDDVLQRLVTFPNVIVTSHQAYFTDRALENIAKTTIANLTAFESGDPLVNEVTLAMLH